MLHISSHRPLNITFFIPLKRPEPHLSNGGRIFIRRLLTRNKIDYFFGDFSKKNWVFVGAKNLNLVFEVFGLDINLKRRPGAPYWLLPQLTIQFIKKKDKYVRKN